MSATKNTWSDVEAAIAVAAHVADEPVDSEAPGLLGDVDTGEPSDAESSDADDGREDLITGSPHREENIMEHMGERSKPRVTAPNPFVVPEGSGGRLIRKGISEREVELIGNLVYDRICSEFGLKRGTSIKNVVEGTMEAIGTTMASEDEKLGKRIGRLEKTSRATDELDARVLSCETKVAELAFQLADNLSTIKEATEQMTAALVKYVPLKADDEDDAKSLPSTVGRAKSALVDITSRIEAVSPLLTVPASAPVVKKPRTFDY